ncbi:hypothetical protein [Hwangdonia seohaensis]|uniref:Uncharacterized protein n=1 Tax=Hwangdonia seohaensis TaxID=1240727 RepID=A0ABW3RDQ3_9FLAO|nr:hypothetical protein [Hwangdonia seohaensis]
MTKLETDMKYNSFYSESDKRIIMTLLGGLDSREIGNHELENASKLAAELSSLYKDNPELNDYYMRRSQTLLKRKKDN